MSFRLVKSEDVPDDAPVVGKNVEGEALYCIVAHTEEWGDIPGKANADGWHVYSYGNEQHTTEDFSWLIVEGGVDLVQCKGRGPPDNAIKCGYQHDGDDKMYAVVSLNRGHCMQPGKAKEDGDQMWYCLDGDSHTTDEFFWLCTRD